MPEGLRFATLCDSCRHCRRIVSGKGSTFLLCRRSQDDQAFAKYPPQPVVRCRGHEPVDDSGHDAAPPST